jgi:hypothetical protein
MKREDRLTGDGGHTGHRHPRGVGAAPGMAAGNPTRPSAPPEPVRWWGLPARHDLWFLRPPANMAVRNGLGRADGQGARLDLTADLPAPPRTGPTQHRPPTPHPTGGDRDSLGSGSSMERRRAASATAWLRRVSSRASSASSPSRGRPMTTTTSSQVTTLASRDWWPAARVHVAVQDHLRCDPDHRLATCALLPARNPTEIARCRGRGRGDHYPVLTGRRLRANNASSPNCQLGSTSSAGASWPGARCGPRGRGHRPHMTAGSA